MKGPVREIQLIGQAFLEGFPPGESFIALVVFTPSKTTRNFS
jgi:hypothetical protein